MFDAHAHLRAAPPQGPVTGWIVPGVDLDSEVLAAQLEAGDTRIRAALGLHPWYLPQSEGELREALDGLERSVDTRQPVAIGETGLDKGRRGAPMAVQRLAFLSQVKLARRLELPLIIHCVRAHGACLELLAEEGGDPPAGGAGMVHDFGGPREMIRPWVEAGFFLSVSPRSLERRSLLAEIPGERLLIETDDEGPERLAEVCDALASARGLTPADIAASTESNARRLFGLL